MTNEEFSKCMNPPECKNVTDAIIEFLSTLDLDDLEDYAFGVRVDEIQYKVGDTANISHQLYQDPQYDDDGELIYERGVGIYSWYYDAGELDGTCCIAFDLDSKESIIKALNAVKIYYGEYIHILCGKKYESGNDYGEIIIEDAKVIASYTKEDL